MKKFVTQETIQQEHDYHLAMLKASKKHNLQILDHGTGKMIDAAIYHEARIKGLKEVML